MMFGVVLPIPCEHCGKPAHYKVREQMQAPYIGMYQSLVARVEGLSADVPVYKRDLDCWLVEIANEQPDAAAQRALNTTRYGRDD